MRVVIQQDEPDICDPSIFAGILQDNPELVVSVTNIDCPVCRVFEGTLDKLEDEQPPRVNLELYPEPGDPCQKIADLLGITKIPTYILFKNGQEVGRLEGTHTEEEERLKDIRKLLAQGPPPS